ncbi:glucuronokinase [Trifolium repens]|nr:transcription factor ABORTED MICROSPORES [Trifolium repens]WJX39111.1 glucuronokinase [Trifolium repens]
MFQSTNVTSQSTTRLTGSSNPKLEHGFVKLMEALNTLGMDVVHATVTSHKSLVSNVFKVEESEIVEAEDVRDSLLEPTRNRSTCWSHEMTTSTSENGVISRQ